MATVDSDDEYWGAYEMPYKMPQERRGLAATTACNDFWTWSETGLADGLSVDAVPASPRLLGKRDSGGSLSTTCSQQDSAELQTAAVVSVEDQSFKLHDLLGSGSFGSVWQASCLTSGAMVAIKEVQSSSHEAMEAAKLEAKRLRALRDLLEELKDEKSFASLPFLVCAEAVRTSSGYRTLLAMEHIRGVPLQQALEAGQLSGHQQHPVALAFRVAGRMLTEISAAMHYVSKRLFHRDVNSHNIMVQALAGEYSFGLIDFGLAVDSTSWASGAWRCAGAAGNGRFWTASTWLMFTHGTEALSSNQDLQSEYARMIDLHSAGLSVLQTFVMVAFGEDERCSSSLSDSEEAASKSLRSLAAVWKQYWCHASSCWQQVLDAFNSDARCEIKMKLAQEMVYATFAAHFANLRAGLVEVYHALQQLLPGRCPSCPTRQWGSLRLACAVVEALLLLISAGRPCRAQADWKQVQRLLVEAEEPEHSGDTE